MSSGSDNSLEDLLEQYRDGNVEAFELFFRKTRNIVFMYVKRRISNTETAHDVTQEIFLRIHRYVTTFDREKGNAMSWIRSIAHNSVSDYLKQLKLGQALPEAEYFLELNSPAGLTDRLFYEEMIFQFKGYLDAEELTMLVDRLIADVSFKDIGIKRGIRTDLARQKFSRILKKIKKFVK